MPAAADPPILIRRCLFSYLYLYDADFACPHSKSPYESLARVPSSSASTAGPQEPYAEGEQYYSQPENEQMATRSFEAVHAWRVAKPHVI